MKGWTILVGILILIVIISSGCTQTTSSPPTSTTTSIQLTPQGTEQTSQPTVEVQTTSPVIRNPVLLEDKTIFFLRGIRLMGVSMKIPKNWTVIYMEHVSIISSYPRDVANGTKDDELLNGWVSYGDLCYPRICEGYQCIYIYNPWTTPSDNEGSWSRVLTGLREGGRFQKDSITYDAVTIDEVKMKRITGLFINGDPFVEYTSVTIPPWGGPISFDPQCDREWLCYLPSRANTTTDMETFDQIVQTVKFLPEKEALKEYDNRDRTNVIVATSNYRCNFPMINTSQIDIYNEIYRQAKG